MAKITEAYIKQNEPQITDLKSTSFKFAHSGSLYSYVEFTAYYGDDEYYNKQISIDDFFDWIGGNILEFNCS